MPPGKASDCSLESFVNMGMPGLESVDPQFNIALKPGLNTGIIRL